MRLPDIIDRGALEIDMRSTSKAETLGELGLLLARSLPELDPGEITECLLHREQLATTGVGDGVAIPHGKLAGIGRIVGALGLARSGIAFDAIDGQPVTILVALLAPPDATSDHLKALARVSRLLKDRSFRERLLASRSNDEAFRILAEEDARC
jgi:PTS system nitrogen regulatory IIA component